MIDPGQDLPERGQFRALFAEINRLKACIRALRPMPSQGSRNQQTAIGTSQQSLRVEETGGQGGGGEATWL